jgi:4-amino-4-deoxy-L-arabinose transferase-like glycosyltransferase
MMKSGFKSRLLDKLFSGSTPAKQGNSWLIIIILLAVMLRVAAAFYMGDQVVDAPGTFDQISYNMLAVQVLEGHGFTVATDWWPATPAGEPTAHWSYLYTLYLVIVYGLFGYHPLIARLIQAVLAGILMPWLVYRLGWRTFNHKVGLITAALMAVYIYFIYYAAALVTETFYIMAILWTLDLAVQLGTHTSPFKLHGLLLGVALAIAVLLRQLFLLFIPILFAWLLWRSYRHQTRPLWYMLRTMVVATLIVIMSILPWTIRNYQAFEGQFVLLNTNAGFAFFWGNHPIHGYNFISILPDNGPSYQDLIPPELKNLNEAALDRALLSRGLTFIQADPVRYFILSLSRIKDYFKFWPSSESDLISNLSRVFSFSLLAPFMGYGLLLSWRRHFSAEALILYLFMAFYTFIHLLSWALIRYRLPVDAVLLVYAGVALMDLWLKLEQRFGKVQGSYTPTPLQTGK